MNSTTRRKRGPAPLPLAEKRDHTVSVRLNAAELAWLDEHRAATKMQRGEYLRSASMGVLPPCIPEFNREVWASLGHIGTNLNQITRRVNSGLSVDDKAINEAVKECNELISLLRFAAIGLNKKARK